jgi:proline utilization trans-activator
VPTEPEYEYVQHPAFARQAGTIATDKLPPRIRAVLLVKVAMRFIGQDYHFFLESEFLNQVNRIYQGSQGELDQTWACKFFAVLALGELYSTTTPNVPPQAGQEHSVPGEDYFRTAVGLLQDRFEEPATEQIENMLLFVSGCLLSD